MKLNVRPKYVRLEYSTLVVNNDRHILDRYAECLVTLSTARAAIEKNNKCKFDSDEHFDEWTRFLGYQ